MATLTRANPRNSSDIATLPGAPSAVLLKHNNLHAEIQFDAETAIGREHAAGVKDVVLEAAITTIQDCEDSVSCVDVKTKIQAYKSWLGLMCGDLHESFEKPVQH